MEMWQNCTSLEVELQSISQEIKILYQSELKQVILESDCKPAVDLIQKR